MRIGYIGNFEPEHSTENHLRRAFEAIGHEVILFQESVETWHELTERVGYFGLDFILWTHTHSLSPPEIHDEIWWFLRYSPVPVVGFHLDRWWGLSRAHQVREPFFSCDLVITADGGHDDEWRANRTNHLWMQPAVLASECEPGTYRPELASDIAFVGSWQGGYHREWQHRADLVDFLQRKYRRKVRFWPEPGQPAVRGQQLRDLYASAKILVGDSCLLNSPRRYTSDRVPETIGRGGFLIHPFVDDVIEADPNPQRPDLYVDGSHMAAWRVGDWDGLGDRISYYLAYESGREAVSRAGRALVLEHHTYEKRAEQIVKQVKERW